MFVLTAEKNLLTIQERETLTSGSVNVYCVRFSFSADWDGLDKIVVFQASEESRSVRLDHANECMIPWETLKEPRTNLFCGVYGTREGKTVLPTIWCSLGRILPGTVPGEDVKSPTPDIWEQLLKQSQEAVETVRQLREEADSGTFNGLEGPQGEQGPQGETGPAGPQGPPGPAAGIASDVTFNNSETSMRSNTVQGAIDELFSSIEDIKEYIGYADKDIAGLCVDYENKTFKRLAGAVGREKGEDFNSFPMFGGRKRCNADDNGTILAYYDDDNYIEDGTNGQVMVYQPAFWYKVVPLVLEKNTASGIGFYIRKANYYVSSIPKPGFKLHPAFYDENGKPVDHILLSAYEGSMWDASDKKYINDNVDTDVVYADGDLLCSVAGQKPISGKLERIGRRTTLETMAQSRGRGWHLSTIKAESANQLLMMIELGTMNTQTAIGEGVVSYEVSTGNESAQTGATASIGNGTGQAAQTRRIGSDGAETIGTESGKASIAYRGVENPWGNIAKHINGINIWGNGMMQGGQVYIADDFKFGENKNDDNYKETGIILPNKSGYISAMGYGKEEYDWVFVPTEGGYDDAELRIVPVGDIYGVAEDLNGYKASRLGGSWPNGGSAGGFFFDYSTNVDRGDRTSGGRLLYIPQKKQ